MDRQNTNPEQEPSNVPPELELAFDGLRAQYDGFSDKEQKKLARLMDEHNAIDHSIDVITLDAKVKLTNRRASPTPKDNVVYRTPEEKTVLEELESPKPGETPKEAEIRERKITIRKATDEATGRGHEEAKAYIDAMREKHATTHRPKTDIEKAAAKRHTKILDGSYHRKDRLTQELTVFESAHGDKTELSIEELNELHPDDLKNLEKQLKIARKIHSSKTQREDKVWESVQGQSPEQQYLARRREAVGKKIAKLSESVRAKGLWIDDLFELNPTLPEEAPAAATPQQPDRYKGRPYPAMTYQEAANAKADVPNTQSRTEQAFNTVLTDLLSNNDQTTVDIDRVSKLLGAIDGASPALAKFTMQRLTREGVIDSAGNVVKETGDIQKLQAEKLKTSLGPQTVEAGTKAGVIDRLKDVRNENDQLYAFALSYIGNFYSQDSKHDPLPALSQKLLADAVHQALQSDQISDEAVAATYNRLISQGMISFDGTVKQSREVIRGALGALYGDDIPHRAKDKKRSGAPKQRGEAARQGGAARSSKPSGAPLTTSPQRPSPASMPKRRPQQ